MRGANAAMGRWNDKRFRRFWRRASFLRAGAFPGTFRMRQMKFQELVSSFQGRVVDIFREGIL